MLFEITLNKLKPGIKKPKNIQNPLSTLKTTKASKNILITKPDSSFF